MRRALPRRGRRARRAVPRDARTRAPTSPAFILYTSGTTKDPKGVMHTHALHASRSGCRPSTGSTRGPDDLVWCTAGTGWAKSIWNVLLGPWSCGARDRPPRGRRSTRRERFELLERLEVTVLCQAPTEYRLMAKLDDLDASRPLAPAPRRLGGRAAQPRGDQGVPRRVRAHDPRRLRPDREHAARREPPRQRDPPGLDGAADAGPRRRGRSTSDGEIVPRRRGGRHRAARPSAERCSRATGTQPEETGGRVPRRVVRHRRPGDPRRGRLPLVHGPRRRRDPLGRVPDRPVRGRERAARASRPSPRARSSASPTPSAARS